MAFALLGKPDEAVAMLQRQANLGFLSHMWRTLHEDEPTFESLKSRADFRKLRTDALAIVARERGKLEKMRVEGLVPDRK